MKFCPVCSNEFDVLAEKCPDDGTILVEVQEEPLLAPDLVIDGRYQVNKEIGRGGFGSIFTAHQISTDRTVAVKVLSKNLSSNKAVVQRFLQESKILARLAHPNIVTVFDSGRMPNGLMYMVMEYLTGSTLDHFIRNREVPLLVVLEILIQICDALSHAHSKGIIHRDLKPPNIFIEEKEGVGYVAKVLDFGIAKIIGGADGHDSGLTQTGITVGSPQYMSPEQAQGTKALDYRADIYSLGIIAYELLAGQPPFIGQNVLEILMKQVKEVPKPIRRINPEKKLPEKLDRLFLGCLEKDPGRRPQSTMKIKETILTVLRQIEKKEDVLSQRVLFMGAHQPKSLAAEPAGSMENLSLVDVNAETVGSDSIPRLLHLEGQSSSKGRYLAILILFGLAIPITIGLLKYFKPTPELETVILPAISNIQLIPAVQLHKNDPNQRFSFIVKSIPRGAKVYHRDTKVFQGRTDFQVFLKKSDEKIPLTFRYPGYKDTTVILNPGEVKAELRIKLEEIKTQGQSTPPVTPIAPKKDPPKPERKLWDLKI